MMITVINFVSVSKVLTRFLSKEFEVDVEISSGAKYILLDEIAENYIEIEEEYNE